MFNESKLCHILDSLENLVNGLFDGYTHERLIEFRLRSPHDFKKEKLQIYNVYRKLS